MQNSQILQKPKRPPTPWNLFVKEHYKNVQNELAQSKRVDSKTIRLGDVMKILSEEARKRGIITGVKREPTQCAQNPYKKDESLCKTNPACAWRKETIMKKTGNPRKAFCTKGMRLAKPVRPVGNFEQQEQIFPKKVTTALGNVNKYNTFDQNKCDEEDDCYWDFKKSKCKELVINNESKRNTPKNTPKKTKTKTPTKVTESQCKSYNKGQCDESLRRGENCFWDDDGNECLYLEE